MEHPADRQAAAVTSPSPGEGATGEEEMAVPKRKTSKAKGRSRQASSWTLDVPARSVCPHCTTAKAPHVVCPNCGWYKGRQAIEVD
jgi:large subunit ribosomal protein L32